jgi:hypothetical protein
MARDLVQLEEQGVTAWGRSHCGWSYRPLGAPIGPSLDEMKRNFLLKRDAVFTSHICGEHPMKNLQGSNEPPLAPRSSGKT